MKLHRPYIPLHVLIQVAERQATVHPPPEVQGRKRLNALLWFLFKGAKFELHHRPALVNRQRTVYTVTKKGQLKTVLAYDPPANDPNFLVYLLAEDHDIETRVRGQGALRSDLGQQRYLKKVARNRARKAKGKRWGSRPWPKGRKIPSRPWPSART